MSLPLPVLIGALAAAQANEVAPALQLHGQPGAPDANYAGGTAATSALMLMLAAAQAAAQSGAGPAEPPDAAAPMAVQAAWAQAQWQVIAAPLGLPLPVPVE